MALKSKPHIKGNKALVSMTIDPDQCAQLDAIVTLRRSSRAAIIREAVDLYLRENSLVQTMTTAHVGQEANDAA